MENRQKALNLMGLAMRAGKVVSGSETVLADLSKNKIKVVVLASDLQVNTTEKVEYAAKKLNVPIIDIFTGTEISSAIGKARKVIAITDSGFYNALAKLIKKGV